MKQLYFALIAAFLLTSCLSIKPGATKTGKKHWEEFYVSDGVIQYFVKPLTYKSTVGEFETDFTFRTNSDSATINYSIIQSAPVSVPERISFSNSKATIEIKPVKILLNEKFKKGYKLRQSGKISMNDFRRLITENTLTAIVKNGTATTVFHPTKKTTKQHKNLNANLFEILFTQSSIQ